jgi:hypothetical protein
VNEGQRDEREEPVSFKKVVDVLFPRGGRPDELLRRETNVVASRDAATSKMTAAAALTKFNAVPPPLDLNVESSKLATLQRDGKLHGRLAGQRTKKAATGTLGMTSRSAEATASADSVDGDIACVVEVCTLV